MGEGWRSTSSACVGSSIFECSLEQVRYSGALVAVGLRTWLRLGTQKASGNATARPFGIPFAAHTCTLCAMCVASWTLTRYVWYCALCRRSSGIWSRMAWVTNQGSVPIRRPVQDMYGCFALSNSRAKLFCFLRGWGEPCSKVVRSVPWVTTWVCRLGNRYARICPRGRRLGGNATLDRHWRGNQRHPRRRRPLRRRRRSRRRGRSATWVE